jgi:hypothetical protein
MFQPLQITIESTADGYLRWEMFYGPERTLHFAGTAPLLERVFEDLLRTQWVLAENLTSDPDALINVLADDPTDTPPVAQVQTPPGHALPAQQDIPPPPHLALPSTSFYPHPSGSG